MEKLFKLSQRGTDVKTEVIAGLTTFGIRFGGTARGYLRRRCGGR